MSLRYTLRLYRTGDAAGFRRAIDELAKKFGGHVEWGTPGKGSECLRLGSSPTVQSLYLPYGVRDWHFFELLSEKSDAAFMELRIQEEALWDYSLHIGTRCVDTFSTLPQYWDFPEELDEQEAKRWAGNPELVATLWQVPLQRIERYYVNWGMQADPDDSGVYNTLLDGKAYPTDEHPYGECRQMFDFLRALGSADTNEEHRFVLPRPVA